MSRIDNQDGAVTVEFVVAFPLLLILGLGIFQLGQIYLAQLMLDHTTWRAARTATMVISENHSLAEPSGFINNPLVSVERSVKNDIVDQVILPALQVIGRNDNSTESGDEYTALATQVVYLSSALKPIQDKVIQHNPGQTIILEISYLYPVLVPIVARLFGRSLHALRADVDQVTAVTDRAFYDRALSYPEVFTDRYYITIRSRAIVGYEGE